MRSNLRTMTTAAGLLIAAVSVSALLSNALAAEPAPKIEGPTWIWAGAKAQEKEKAFFRREFALREPARAAYLTAVCDDSLKVFLDGKPLTTREGWTQPETLDITNKLRGGKHVLAVEGLNHTGPAALLVKLEITQTDGVKHLIVSESSWLASSVATPNWQELGFDAKAWKPAHPIAAYGAEPWGTVLANALPPGAATPAKELTLLPGFQAELLYSVPKADQGSWVALTFDNRGRAIVSDQEGLLYRITPPQGSQPIRVEPLPVPATSVASGEPKPKDEKPLGKAQGLLYAYDSLYVVVNSNAAQGPGLYRLRDTNGDDRYDELKLLKKFNGSGEHGPHAVRLAPDGRLCVIAGNATKVPEGYAPTSPHHNWSEDILLPRQPDGRGFMTGVLAPGGWIAKTDPEGKAWEIFCGGFRNPYDMDFNQDGELFTYDADMEWDVGTSWYRPTRVNHCISGAEFGWRYGSGKWPAHWADSMPGFDIGLGSPTGVAFGTGAKFPAKYQRALFTLDWTYGKIYAMHFTPRGSSYTATFEQFAAAKPLPVTDVAVGPDGALYFTIGGRGTQSGLYRISYTGSESTAPVGPIVDPVARADRAMRHKLEAFHGHVDPAAVDAAWPLLASKDRAMRNAARVAIEWQDPAQWQERALAERNPMAATHALIALARTNRKELQPKILSALGRLQFDRMSEDEQLAATRAYELTFTRLGQPDTAKAQEVGEHLNRFFPGPSALVNRELCQLLVYLDHPQAVPKAMKQLSEALTQEEQLAYAFPLRTAKSGWTPELRKAYLSWYNVAQTNFVGGSSFSAFLEQMKAIVVEHLRPEEKQQFASILERKESVQVVRNEKPRKFIHNWQMEDLVPILDQSTHGRSFAGGRAALEAAQCLRCHRFKTEGNSVAHDLTGAGNRFSPRDLLESIILPSKVISDQYASKTVVTNDGLAVTGLAQAQEDGSLIVYQSNGQEVKIAKQDIEQIEVSPISTMPEGLLSILTKDEVLDLIAYLRSAGDPKDKAFGGAK